MSKGMSAKQYHHRLTQSLRDTSVYTIENVPGKGRGLVATHHIQRGELVLVESPLFMEKPGCSTETIIATLSQLPRDDQRAYFSLFNAFPDSKSPLGIWMTNAKPCWGSGSEDAVDTGEGLIVAGLFLTASLFNHSCEPNVFQYWNHEVRRMEFRAMREIIPGEELTIACTDLFAPRDERRAEIKATQNFECVCNACSRTGEEVRLSDRRRKELGRLFFEISEHTDDPVLGLRKVRADTSFRAVVSCISRRKSHWLTMISTSAGQVCLTIAEERAPVRSRRRLVLRGRLPTLCW